MRKIILFALAVSCAVTRADGIVGRWKTVDDETGKPKSIVEIFKDGDQFKAKVVELINPDEPNPRCKHCPDDKKDKPVIGIEFMWDMKETKPGMEWSQGHIMDPKNGKVYRCKMHLEDGGEKLDVRGYLGFSFIGRTQTWLREKAPAG